MPTINCPTCGKPLRPGARFCGNCGATISAAAQSANAPPVVEPDANPCPNCGKPVRSWAKFCTHCGTDLAQPGGSIRGKPEQNQAAPQIAARTGVVSPGAGSPAEFHPGMATPAAAVQKPKRNAAWLFLLLGIAILCLLGVVGGIFVYRDSFNILRSMEPSSVALVSAETATATEPAILEATTLPTQEEKAPSSTTGIPSTSTQSPTGIASATPSITSTVEITETQAPISGAPAALIILDDEFSETLSENWRAWGNPLPTLKKGFGDSWLDLKAVDNPAEAGATTRKEITLAPGIWIVVEAQLNPTYPQSPLMIDWDPFQFIRGPANSTPTQLHLELKKNRIQLLAPVTNEKCEIELDGTIKHIFSLFFADEQTMELSIDEDLQSLCQLDLGVPLGPGRLSFSGNGWVTRIRVSDSQPR